MKILITGANSYIGTSVRQWLEKTPEQYRVDILDMIDEKWSNTDFSLYDVVFHVAGIAHVDVGTVTEEKEKLYYQVNTKLAVETAEKARAEGVRQFIFMSSMIVYSGCKEKIITKETVPRPLNVYGESKWMADQKIQKLANDNFKVAVLRPPMVYGKGSKGNYGTLAKIALNCCFFPRVHNKRSMLHIDNLCEFVKLIIDYEENGIFFPQNAEYASTSLLVKIIAEAHNHKMILIPHMDILIKLFEKIPGKPGELAAKAFGTFAYDMGMSEYKRNYRVNNLQQSIGLTER